MHFKKNTINLLLYICVTAKIIIENIKKLQNIDLISKQFGGLHKKSKKVHKNLEQNHQYDHRIPKIKKSRKIVVYTKCIQFI